MRLTMLGTGNATATECYNTCFVISDNKKHFLVDAGGGNHILKVLKDVKISLTDIHDIFLTHNHIDHLLGVIWIIRVVGQKINKGSYDGDLRIFTYNGLGDTIKTIVDLTIQKSIAGLLGSRIHLIPVENGEKQEIIGCKVTFFDIGSMKAKQFGFTIITPEGRKLSCCGDEPYNRLEEEYVKGSDWLMHEAYCMFGEADRFKPYEKYHCTVKEACQNAEELQAANLILYHTEDTHLPERKKLYTQEGSNYYHGNIVVPDDKEVINI